MIKAKRLNVYLTPIDYKELNQIKEKYKLSFSTIGNILGEELHLINIPTDKRLFKDENEKKTSLKPRNKSLKAIELENAIKLFTRKKLKHYILDNLKGTEEEKLKIYSKIQDQIYKLFNETYDENYDGNKWNRIIPKFIKHNPKYTKRLLGIEDDR